jgi:hypothetical protein
METILHESHSLWVFQTSERRVAHGFMSLYMAGESLIV